MRSSQPHSQLLALRLVISQPTSIAQAQHLSGPAKTGAVCWELDIRCYAPSGYYWYMQHEPPTLALRAEPRWPGSCVRLYDLVLWYVLSSFPSPHSRLAWVAVASK